MYVRCVLKPVISRVKKTQVATEATGESLSDHEVEQVEGVQEVGDPLLHASSYAAAKTSDLPSEAKPSADQNLQMALNFVFEVLLSIKPEDIGTMFLVYDCQHFSESLITKSLNLLIKYSKPDSHQLKYVLLKLSESLAKIAPKDLDSS